MGLHKEIETVFDKVTKHLNLLLIPLLVYPFTKSPAVDVSPVAGTWRPLSSAFAHISASKRSGLKLPFSVRVVTLAAEPGARVATGEPLAQLAAPVFEQHLAAWWTARRALTLTRENLDMLRNGEQQHTTTRLDFLAGEQALVQAAGLARQRWETLRADLDHLSVHADAASLATRMKSNRVALVAQSLSVLRAPFDGVMVRRDALTGEWIEAGQTLLEIQALKRVYVDAGVPAAALPKWRNGETRWHWDGKYGILDPLPTAPRFDAGTGLWLLRFQADNPDLVLRDGLWLEIEHRGVARAAVWVPSAAVVARNGKTWCVVHEGDRFKPVEVRVGGAVGGRIPVLSGLAPGTRVVTAGAYEYLYRDLKDLIRFED